MKMNKDTLGYDKNDNPTFVINEGGTPSIQEGTTNERPSAKIKGRLFLDTNYGILYRDTGVRWKALQLGPEGPQGHRGPRGYQGYQGYQGPQGVRGATGKNGSSILSGSGAPTLAIGNIGDIYIDTTTGEVYIKIASPIPPGVRTIPPPTGATLLVGTGQTYATIDAALLVANNGDRLLLNPETFDLTATINVNKSVTIEGQTVGANTTIVTSSHNLYPLFNINVSNVVIENMNLVQSYEFFSSSTAIGMNNLSATGIYINNCQIAIADIGIYIGAAEFQISNCNFTYVGPASHGYDDIIITATSGKSIIYNNTFVSESTNNQSKFTRITNLTGTLQGELLVGNNVQLLSSHFPLKQLLLMEEFVGSNFELFIDNNITSNEGNAPVLLYNVNNSIFSFIEVSGNSVQNTAGKGLIAVDSSSTGSTVVYASNNSIANQTWATGWATATIPASFIVGYNTTAISPAPVYPLESSYWQDIGISLNGTSFNAYAMVHDTASSLITPGSAILLNIADLSSGVSYVSATGNFTIASSGQYLVNWWVSISNNSGAAMNVVVNLTETSPSTALISTAITSSPIPNASDTVVFGTGIINVTVPNSIYQFQNGSTGNISTVVTNGYSAVVTIVRIN